MRLWVDIDPCAAIEAREESHGSVRSSVVGGNAESAASPAVPHSLPQLQVSITPLRLQTCLVRIFGASCHYLNGTREHIYNAIHTHRF